MGINFPNAPTVGQLWPQPAVVGVPVWKWNGSAWVTVGGTGLATIYIADTPPSGAPDNSMWWESDTGLLYVRYNDGDSSQWVIAVPGSDIANYAIRFDQPQMLTAAQQTQARQNIFAAPFDALAFNGMQVNGNMEVSQELGTSGTNVNGRYGLDGFQIYWAGTMVLTAGQYNGLISPANGPSNSALATSVTTAEPTLGANDYAMLLHSIEGYRVARLQWGTPNAQPITIAFWTQHSVAGSYSGAVRNAASNRSYVFSYTQNVANVYEYKTVTIPGDTGGTWQYTNSAGLVIDWALAVGANFAAAPGSWLAGNYLGSTNQVNTVASTSNVCRLTGVMVLPGIEAPSAARAPLIMRPYAQELITCQRYLWVTAGGDPFMGAGYSTTTALFAVLFPQPLRTAPGSFKYSALTDWIIGNTGLGFSALTCDISSPTSARLNGTTTGIGAGTALIMQSNAAGAYLLFDARL